MKMDGGRVEGVAIVRKKGKRLFECIKLNLNRVV
jgi:hypothetical protein